jgi:cytidylate kinase
MPLRSVEEIVHRQGRRWELLANAGRRAAQCTTRRCIALSRLPESGAEELGRILAERLDYGFFDIEIVDQIARAAGIQRQLVAGVDEHVRSVIDRYVTDSFSAGAFTESDYLRALVRAVHTLSERGMAVILGRGSPFILTAEQALRVLVVADRTSRVERLAAREGLEVVEAERLLDQREAGRHEFLHHHFGVDPDDPALYDLVINTGTLGMDCAAAVVLEALARRTA